jgi:hypothetical protein
VKLSVALRTATAMLEPISSRTVASACGELPIRRCWAIAPIRRPRSMTGTTVQ